LNAGIAGVTALSSIPYSSGNKFSYGIGMGNYQNGNAVVAGVQFRVSPSTNVRLNISWDSAGNNATGVPEAGKGWDKTIVSEKKGMISPFYRGYCPQSQQGISCTLWPESDSVIIV
ncbi:hypothetical protein AVM50_23420, partial [Salmonella enterica]|nr:hypothetical protein [Salmonella enterica]